MRQGSSTAIFHREARSTLSGGGDRRALPAGQSCRRMRVAMARRAASPRPHPVTEGERDPDDRSEAVSPASSGAAAMIRGAWSMTAARRQPEVRVTHDLAGLTDLDAEPSYFGASLPVAVERAEGLFGRASADRRSAGVPVSPRIVARPPLSANRVAPVNDDVFDALVLADTVPRARSRAAVERAVAAAGRDQSAHPRPCAATGDPAGRRAPAAD